MHTHASTHACNTGLSQLQHWIQLVHHHALPQSLLPVDGGGSLKEEALLHGMRLEMPQLQHLLGECAPGLHYMLSKCCLMGSFYIDCYEMVMIV